MSKGLRQDHTLNQILVTKTGIEQGSNILNIASGSGNPVERTAALINGGAL